MPNHSSTPKCPACGFTIFTNRYPKCERCGIQLPPSLVLSKDELQKVLEQEREEAFKAKELSRRKEASAPGSTSIDVYWNAGMDFDFGSFE